MKARPNVCFLESGVSKRKSTCRICKNVIPIGSQRVVEFCFATRSHCFKRYIHKSCAHTTERTSTSDAPKLTKIARTDPPSDRV